jgi:apolipoprotein N-acyltransferase
MRILILAIPIVWTLADSRLGAFASVLAYKLSASRGLLPGAAVFLSEDHTFAQAAALYFLLPFCSSLPYLLFWSGDSRRKPACLSLIFITAYIIPPLSLIGILNPLMAAGTIFKGCGFAGIFTALAMYSLCAVSRDAVKISFCAIALFLLAPDSWHNPPAPEGIAAADTSFGRLGSGSFSFSRDYERANMVFSGLKKRGEEFRDAQIIVLPETIAGRMNKTGLELWRDGMRKVLPSKTVIFGGELPADGGRKYDNAALMLHDGEITVSRQRIPVPYSMYQGPFAGTGARLHITDGGILPLPDGRRAAVIICYEAFLTWPVLASMARRPDMIICISNLWWCRDTSLPDSQESAVSLWALTFGVPVLFVRNI